jgi:hypothetical protein
VDALKVVAASSESALMRARVLEGAEEARARDWVDGGENREVEWACQIRRGRFGGRVTKGRAAFEERHLG